MCVQYMCVGSEKKLKKSHTTQDASKILLYMYCTDSILYFSLCVTFVFVFFFLVVLSQKLRDDFETKHYVVVNVDEDDIRQKKIRQLSNDQRSFKHFLLSKLFQQQHYQKEKEKKKKIDGGFLFLLRKHNRKLDNVEQLFASLY